MRESSQKPNTSPDKLYRLVGIAYCTYSPFEQKKVSKNEAYCIHLFTEGEGRLVVNGLGYQVERGKCVIAEPDMTVTSEAYKHGLKGYELTFEVLSVEKYGKPATQKRPAFPYVGEVECAPLSQCLEWAQAIYSYASSESKNELGSLEQHIHFQELLRHIIRQNLQTSHLQNSRQAVEATINRLRQEYRYEWSVSQMAKMADLGRWQYTRLFKEMTGQVPLQYLSSIRIEQAKHLLQATDDRLFDIAENVGFGDEFYFNRRFKQTVGVSPGQYRRHYREEIRIFAPFLEDFLVTLGITPVLQSSFSRWGAQSYLQLHSTPAVEMSAKGIIPLPCKPDLIMVDYGFSSQWDSDLFSEKAPIYRMSNQGEDWQATLQTIADIIGRGKSAKMVDAISSYERKAEAARKKLRAMRRQTTAFLRVNSNGIRLYGGPDKSFTGPVLYRDLELTPHPLVQQFVNCDRTAELTPDMLNQLDADNLFVTFDISEKEKHKLLATSLWRSLPAVRCNRVFEVDFLSWMNYGILAHGKKIDDVLHSFQKQC